MGANFILTVNGYTKCCPAHVVFSSPCICSWQKSDEARDHVQPPHGECLPDPETSLVVGLWPPSQTCWRRPQRVAFLEICGHYWPFDMHFWISWAGQMSFLKIFST